MAERDIPVRETEDARKHPYEEDDIPDLLRGVSKVITARGKKSQVHDLKKGAEPEEVASACVGPTGKLRAPSARVGKTLIVGWGEEAWDDVFG